MSTSRSYPSKQKDGLGEATVDVSELVIMKVDESIADVLFKKNSKSGSGG